MTGSGLGFTSGFGCSTGGGGVTTAGCGTGFSRRRNCSRSRASCPPGTARTPAATAGRSGASRSLLLHEVELRGDEDRRGEDQEGNEQVQEHRRDHSLAARGVAQGNADRRPQRGPLGLIEVWIGAGQRHEGTGVGETNFKLYALPKGKGSPRAVVRARCLCTCGASALARRVAHAVIARRDAHVAGARCTE